MYVHAYKLIMNFISIQVRMLKVLHQAIEQAFVKTGPENVNLLANCFNLQMKISIYI